jgi:hypothetical protein
LAANCAEKFPLIQLQLILVSVNPDRYVKHELSAVEYIISKAQIIYESRQVAAILSRNQESLPKPAPSRSKARVTSESSIDE